MENNMGPWIGVINSIVGWTFFLICLAMFKNFISTGFSYALSEMLLKQCNQEQREKLVRWLADGDTVLERLEELDQKLAQDEKKTKTPVKSRRE